MVNNLILEDGSKVILHRFPMSQKKAQIKRQWISKVKTVRANFVLSDSSRICSAHFEGTFTDESVLTVFPSKPVKQTKERRPLTRHADFKSNIPVNNTVSESSDTAYMTCPSELSLSLNNIEDESVMEISPEQKCLAVSSNTANKCTSTCTEFNSNEVGVQVGLSFSITSDVAVQCDLPRMIYEDIKDSDEKVRFYTGFPTFQVFWMFFLTLLKHGAEKLNYWEGERRSMGDKQYHQEGHHKPGKRRFLRPIDEFLLTSMRLRLGLNQEHLADIFRISRTTVSRILNTWVNFIYDHSKGLIAWPTREQILANLRRHFNNHSDTRIVVDCTEFFVERPSSLVSQLLTWSEYKHHKNFKILKGLTPNGMVSFVSRLWGGNASDRHIVQNDDLIPKLSPGDVIMADKGFTINDLLPANIGLNVPPRVSTKSQMSSSEFFKTAHIASARIVVEMKMEQVKNFQILNSVLPLSEAHLAEQIIVACVSLTNLLPPLLQ